MKLEDYLTPHTKINSKWIKDLNVRSDKTLRGKHRQNTLNHSKICFDPSPRVMKIKTKINIQDLIKLKSFYGTNETISEMKRPPSGWQNIFSNKAVDKRLISFVKINSS